VLRTKLEDPQLSRSVALRATERRVARQARSPDWSHRALTRAAEQIVRAHESLDSARKRAAPAIQRTTRR